MPSLWVTMREMSTAALPIRSIAESTWSTLDIFSASRGDRAASTQTSRIACTRSSSWLLERLHLVRHARVAEEQRGVGEVDHELGDVFRLREHGLQIARLVVGHQLPAVPVRFNLGDAAAGAGRMAGTPSEIDLTTRSIQGDDRQNKRRGRRAGRGCEVTIGIPWLSGSRPSRYDATAP